MRSVGLCVLVACLSAPASAQEDFPPNTIDCTEFQMQGNAWIQIGTGTFDVGAARDAQTGGVPIMPNAIKVDQYDLYTLLEMKCGGVAPTWAGATP